MIEKINKLRADLKEYVKDKSIPLEERWNTFIESKMGRHQGGLYYDFTSLDQLPKLTKKYTELLNELQQIGYNFQHFDVTDVIEFFEEKASEEELNNFKEEAMNDFIFSWEMDW